MNWKEIKRFNQLFSEGETSIDLMKCSFAQRVKEMGYIIENKKIITKTDLYDDFFTKQLLPKFYTYNKIIESYNLINSNFDEKELDALVKIKKDKEQILDDNQSIKELGTLYFDSAKYLKKQSKLYEVILKILDVSELPIDEHDQQYLTVLHCKNKTPKAIILCENKNKLIKPRLENIELWYAGGRNTAKLKYIIEPTIPFYYLCDWDNKGIEIYQDIKKNIFPNIEILVPQKPIKYLDKMREWKTEIDCSLFSFEARQLLQEIVPEKWIEEESVNNELFNG
jgi:hypothetical protein